MTTYVVTRATPGQDDPPVPGNVALPGGHLLNDDDEVTLTAEQYHRIRPSALALLDVTEVNPTVTVDDGGGG